MRVLILLLFTAFATGFSLVDALEPAYASSHLLCYEDGSYCDWQDGPFNAVVAVYTEIAGVWFYIGIWAVILITLWFMTGSAMIASIVGVFVSGIMTTGLIGDEVIGIGYGLAGITIGIYAFFIFMKAQYT